MTTIVHSTLTGSDLHENKGAAAASDNTVATAITGTTLWKKLDNTNLSSMGNPFGASLFHIREQQAQGVATSSPTGSGVKTLVLNTTMTNEITSATLSSNQLSLPAGTYFAAARASFSISAENAKLVVWNVSDSAALLVGIDVSGTGPATLTCDGRFTLAGTKTVELRRVSSGGSASSAANFTGLVEVYTDFLVWKIA